MAINSRAVYLIVHKTAAFSHTLLSKQFKFLTNLTIKPATIRTVALALSFCTFGYAQDKTTFTSFLVLDPNGNPFDFVQ